MIGVIFEIQEIVEQKEICKNNRCFNKKFTDVL